MRILSLDSSGFTGSVCVSRGGDVVAEVIVRGPRGHAARLFPCIEEVLAHAGLGLEDLDGVAVTVGPGSFTGVRVALTIAKGLAYVLEKPLVGISTLRALAANVPCPGLPVVAVVDARKKQVYTARFVPLPGGGMQRSGPERVVSPHVLAGEIPSPSILIGDGVLAYTELFRDRLGEGARIPQGPVHHVRASQVAALALPRFLRGEVEDPFRLVPRYLRPSDAELHRSEGPGPERGDPVQG